MSYPIRWKPLAVFLGLIFLFPGCHKSGTQKNPEPEPVPPSPLSVESVFEPVGATEHTGFCGDQFTTDLKIQNGTSIGTVIVGNDAAYLYLTYNLKNDWRVTGVHAYAGKKGSIPFTGSGRPDHRRFPGKKNFDPCSIIQRFGFRIPLSALQTDNSSQCPSNTRYLISMRATVKKINSATVCDPGNDQEAWAAPVLINPGSSDEWATAFYYCRQECNNLPPVITTPPASAAWCGYGQGYWFSKPNVIWCQPSVRFGGLEIFRDDARALWPAQNNTVKKAFFQASSLQLSKSCFNDNREIPAPIAADYEVVKDFLSTLTYNDIKNGTYPPATDISKIKAAVGNIGNWNCGHKCDPSADQTSCDE